VNLMTICEVSHWTEITQMLGEIRTATAPQESSIRSTHIPENLLAVGSRQPGCRITVCI
jgi:hypothetical protein